MSLLAAFDARGATPAARRSTLARASDAEIGEQLLALALALRETVVSHDSLARAANLPLGEVVASPFALRSVALGVEVGACAVHRELRLAMPWVEPELADPEHGVWDRGVLSTGKYQGFLADEAFAVFDPAHVSKWGPHELLHRAARFFHRSDASRWEVYLGARLNELVPVVVFYGPEQALRLDEGAFDRRAAARSPAATRERAIWLERDEAELREHAMRAAPILREGILHFSRDLAAIDEELVTGRRVRVEHEVLDASSDATAYVVGHYQRLSSDALRAVLGEVLPDSIVVRDVGAYRDHVERLFDRLLFAPLPLDLERADALRSGRALWDLLHRAALVGQGVEHVLEPLFDSAREALENAELGGTLQMQPWRERIASVLEPDDASMVLADGSEHGPALEQLDEGLASILPCTRALLEENALGRLASSPCLWQRARLSLRVLDWLAFERADSALSAMARFEHGLATVERDDQIERLCVPLDELPDPLDGMLVRNARFVRVTTTHQVVETHARFNSGEAVALPERGDETWLFGAHFDEVSLIPCPDGVSAAWELLADGAKSAREIETLVDRKLGEVPEGWPTDGASWLRELLRAGALGYLAHAVVAPTAVRGDRR